MGMPCEVNSILKLTLDQGYPTQLEVGERFKVAKSGYRIFPIDVPLMLVDETWVGRADIRIDTLIWAEGVTRLEFEIVRVYETTVLCR